MLELVLGVLIGIFLHRAYIHIRVQMLEKRIEQKIDAVLTEYRKNIIDSKIEYVNNTYFLYNKDTNEFLGQGSTFEELESFVRQKYPDKKFNVPQSELNQLLRGENGSR